MPTALPPSSDFSGSTTTKGSFKAWGSSVRDYLAGLFGTDGATTTALATLGAPLSGYTAKTGAYSIAAADRGKLIDCTGTWTLGALAAATAGDGFTVAVRNSGTGLITLDPNSSETVDGAATLAINAGEALLFYCTGTAWVSVGKSSGVPSGSMTGFAGSTTPSGWLLCDGSAVSRTTYASLYTAIGTTYGVGDGSSTFNLPDLRGRVVAGKDNMGGSAASRITSAGSGITGTTLGATGGAETHTLTTAQLASHSHDVAITDGGAGFSTTISATTSGYTLDATTTAGSGSAHNNTQPTLIANYIIKT